MRKLLSRAFVLAGMLALAACGGGEHAFESPGQNGGTGGTGGGGTTATPTAITATTSVPSIPSDGSASADITALVRDATNNLIPGVVVGFTASSGGIAVTQATTDTSGAAKATLTTAGDPTPRTITVTVTAGTLTATVNVQVSAGGGSTTTVSMGSGTGTSFQAGVLGVSNNSVSAGGSTTLTAVLQQSDGTLYTQSAAVTFNSPCVANGQAVIQPQPTATTTTGIATVTYSAKGCSGSDPVTATATVGSSTLSATATVTVAQAAVGSIAFVSATPTNIALKGTGDASRPESSVVVFKVLDAAGGPRSGATVSFVLNTTVGGMTLTPATATATSDALGQVQIVVNAGTVATSVKVTATITSTTPTISTQSSQLTVTTGIPTANNISLAVACFNIEGWDIDGTQTDVTARLADRFQNPVPDGTAVTFHSKGAKIGAQCTTATTATEAGVCSVKFTSQNFRPADGRIPLLAMAIGEESFTDANGNGAFDTGEAFTDSEEPFEDDAGAGTGNAAVYATNDYFFDFNNTGNHDGPDSSFNGVLCNDAARCAGPKSAGIGARNEIILSGSTPVIDELNGSNAPIGTPMLHGGSTSFWVRDGNGNPMPGNTTVSASFSPDQGSTATLGTPNSFTVPCALVPINSKNAATVFPFSFSGAGTGTFTLTVKTPLNHSTILQIPVSVP
jgi:Bacterial Ig-like domain (group 1)